MVNSLAAVRSLKFLLVPSFPTYPTSLFYSGLGLHLVDWVHMICIIVGQIENDVGNSGNHMLFSVANNFFQPVNV